MTAFFICHPAVDFDTYRIFYPNVPSGLRCGGGAFGLRGTYSRGVLNIGALGSCGVLRSRGDSGWVISDGELLLPLSLSPHPVSITPISMIIAKMNIALRLYRIQTLPLYCFMVFFHPRPGSVPT